MRRRRIVEGIASRSTSLLVYFVFCVEGFSKRCGRLGGRVCRGQIRSARVSPCAKFDALQPWFILGGSHKRISLPCSVPRGLAASGLGPPGSLRLRVDASPQALPGTNKLKYAIHFVAFHVLRARQAPSHCVASDVEPEHGVPAYGDCVDHIGCHIVAINLKSSRLEP